jgi:hypothetical protein
VGFPLAGQRDAAGYVLFDVARPVLAATGIEPVERFQRREAFREEIVGIVQKSLLLLVAK